jgi:hypothetical protein
VFRYKLYTPDGDELGEATYAVMITPGEEILVGNDRRFRVLDVVPFEEEDEVALRGAVAGRGRVATPSLLRLFRVVGGRARAGRAFP